MLPASDELEASIVSDFTASDEQSRNVKCHLTVIMHYSQTQLHVSPLLKHLICSPRGWMMLRGQSNLEASSRLYKLGEPLFDDTKY